MAAKFTKFFSDGFRLVNCSLLNTILNNPQFSYEDAITAFAGGGQTNAYQISAYTSRISVCATNADSVKLPKTSKNQGARLLIINDGAANLAVFPFDTATIDGGAASASVTITAGKRALFTTEVDGAWQSAGMSKTT